jgi:hypothetical protein
VFEKKILLWQNGRMSCLKRPGMVLLIGLCGALVAGCKHSDAKVPVAPTAASTPASFVMKPVVRLHWIGRKQLAGETNAAGLLRVWNRAESLRLENQTLDKLARAPWPGWSGDANTSAIGPGLLRPLLDDLVAREFYFGINQATNGRREWVVAVRLDDARAGLWETNLAAALKAMTGSQPKPSPAIHGWSVTKRQTSRLIELARAGEWTLVGAATERNALLQDFLARLQSRQAPFEFSGTNSWLEVEADLAELIKPGPSPEPWPKIQLAFNGEGENVITRGRLEFSQPLSLELPAWNIPTNLIHESLASLTFVRGIGQWLERLPGWNDLGPGQPPNQICFWASQGAPMQTYFAAPLPDASNRVSRAADLLLEKSQGWLAGHELAGFRKSPGAGGLEWTGMPFLSPFFRSTNANDSEFVLGGCFVDVPGPPIAPEMFPSDFNQTNLVSYDWELTGLRAEQWIYISQFMRAVAKRPQLSPEFAGLAWLKAVSELPGASISQLTWSGPNQLSFARKSSLGLTAIELLLLVEWLESPVFPRSLHTLAAPPVP